MKLKIKDQVKVLSGRDRAKTGEIERLYEKQNRVLVKGVNLVKKHVKKSEQFPKGEILTINKPIACSKLMLICPRCQKPTRISYLFNKDGKKERVCKKCQKVI
jgi:large subunit ribosomal protein L24